VYGGYTGQSWNGSPGQYINDSTAFLYQLKFSENDQRTKFPVVKSSYALYSYISCGPIFGGGSYYNLYTFSNTINQSNGVYVLNSNVNFDDSYQMSTMSPKVKSWNDINNGTMNVTELEVYKVTGTFCLISYNNI